MPRSTSRRTIRARCPAAAGAAQAKAVATLIAEIGAGVSGSDALDPNDLQILTYNAIVSGRIQRRDAGANDYTALEAWVRALPTATSGGTDYGAAASDQWRSEFTDPSKTRAGADPGVDKMGGAGGAGPTPPSRPETETRAPAATWIVGADRRG